MFKKAAVLTLLAGGAAATKQCHGVDPSYDSWCQDNCNADPVYCPSDVCVCTAADDDTWVQTDDTPAPTDDTPAPVDDDGDDTPAPQDDDPSDWPDLPKDRIVAYLTNWGWYSQGTPEFPASVARRMTDVVYAFTTTSYSASADAYYISPADPWADSGACVETESCWGEQPDCLPVPGMCLVPYLGAVPDGEACPTDCTNEGGSPLGRSPQCLTTLDTYTHPSTDANGTVTQTVCGLTNYVLGKVAPEPHAEHINWLLSIGGWYDVWGFTMATSDAYRASYVQSIVAYVTALGFQGVDIDWEYPTFGRDPEDIENLVDCGEAGSCSPDRSADGDNFLKLLQDLRAAFDAVGPNAHGDPYQLSIAGPAGQDKFSRLPLKDMCAIDGFYVNVMAYDMHVAGENLTDHQAPLYAADGQYSVDAAVQGYLDAGCAPEDLNVGLPFYGRLWNAVAAGDDEALPGLGQTHTGPSEDTCERSVDQCTPAYSLVDSTASYELYWDDEAQASFGYDAAAKNWVSFDTPQAFQSKVDYGSKNQLGGYMYWAIGDDTDDNELLETLYDAVQAS